MRPDVVLLGLMLSVASAQAQTPTPAANKGDTIRFGRQAVAPIPGLDALKIIATAGDTVVVRKGGRCQVTQQNNRKEHPQ